MVLEDGTLLVTYASTPVYYFDVFYRTSCDGNTWSDEIQLTNEVTRYDTQPHPILQGTPGHFMLTWSHQDSVNPYEDHDVWINTDIVVPMGIVDKSVSPIVGPNSLRRDEDVASFICHRQIFDDWTSEPHCQHSADAL